jgi:hypothetical protein
MKTIFISVISILFSVSIFAQGSATLKYNLEKNKVYRFQTTSDQSVSQTMGGMTNNSQISTNVITSLKVVDVKPEFMVAEIRFESNETKSSAMGKNTTISSSSEGDYKSGDMVQVVSYFMNQMTKNPLFVKMDYSGKIIEMVNIKMFSDIVLKNLDSVSVDGPMGAMIPNQVKSMVEEKTLKTMIESVTNYLPGKSVAIGDKWEVNNAMSANGMSFTINSIFKLESITNGVATVSAEANVLPATSEPMEMMGAKVNFSELKGLNKSTILIDVKTGLIQESNGKTSMAGNLGVEAGGQSMQIPMEIKGDSKVVVLP